MARPPFLFTAGDGVGHATITLRGRIDAAAAEEFGAYLDGFLRAATRSITVDATDVTSCDPRVLELLARTRRRLGGRGAITVHGLHPSALPARAPGVVDPGAAPCATPIAGAITSAVTEPATHRRIKSCNSWTRATVAGSGHVVPRTGSATVPGATCRRWAGPRMGGRSVPPPHPEPDPEPEPEPEPEPR